jgi:hypothetical protein
VQCDEGKVEALVPALQALPMVTEATARGRVLLPATVSYCTNPDANRTTQIQPAPNGVDAIHVWQVAGGTAKASSSPASPTRRRRGCVHRHCVDTVDGVCHRRGCTHSALLRWSCPRAGR